VERKVVEEIVRRTGLELQTVLDLLENGWVYDAEKNILVPQEKKS
jgi:hypothetical protein